jgi:hypothetical protein
MTQGSSRVTLTPRSKLDLRHRPMFEKSDFAGVFTWHSTAKIITQSIRFTFPPVRTSCARSFAHCVCHLLPQPQSCSVAVTPCSPPLKIDAPALSSIPSPCVRQPKTITPQVCVPTRADHETRMARSWAKVIFASLARPGKVGPSAPRKEMLSMRSVAARLGGISDERSTSSLEGMLS